MADRSSKGTLKIDEVGVEVELVIVDGGWDAIAQFKADDPAGTKERVSRNRQDLRRGDVEVEFSRWRRSLAAHHNMGVSGSSLPSLAGSSSGVLGRRRLMSVA
jgi:hypothetical protein